MDVSGTNYWTTIPNTYRSSHYYYMTWVHRYDALQLDPDLEMDIGL